MDACTVLGWQSAARALLIFHRGRHRDAPRAVLKLSAWRGSPLFNLRLMYRDVQAILIMQSWRGRSGIEAN